MATLARVSSVAELRQKRLHDCRLTSDRKLETLDDAEAFLVDRGVLTLTQDSALPSLFAATHEQPYKSGSAGFGSWPKTKWPWGGELALRPGVHSLKVHRGKVLLSHQAAMRAIDPLARAALAEADAAGDERSRLVRHLRSAGPSKLDDVKSELARWDQVWNKPWKANQDQALAELVLIGVRAAVLAHQDEVGKWFSWPVEWPLLADLISARRLVRPGPGWLAAA